MAASSGPLWYQPVPQGGREAASGTRSPSRAGSLLWSLLLTRLWQACASAIFGTDWKELAGRNLLTRFHLAAGAGASSLASDLLLDGGVPMLRTSSFPARANCLSGRRRSLARRGDMEDFSLDPANLARAHCVKGVLTSEDARRAVDHGAVAVVSRIMWTATRRRSCVVDVLPEVVKRVGSRVEVLIDGGIVAVPMLSKQSA